MKISARHTLSVYSLLAVTSANAGFVSWGAPQTISGDADISTSGAFIEAYNLGTFGVPSTVVNGVTFSPFATSTTSNTVGTATLASSANILGNNTSFGEILPPFSLLTTNYKTLLQSGSYTVGVAPAAISLTLGGLTPGTQYQFEWWANQSDPLSFDPNAPPPALPSTTATAGNSVTLVRTGLAPGSVGQFAIGTFTADAASQVVTFNGSDTKTLLNAFQLRQLGTTAVPEPGSCLFGFATMGFLLRSASRRRRALSAI